MDSETRAWWTLLRLASVGNLGAWALTAALAPAEGPVRLAHLGLSAVYVAVCGFRSFYPRVDLERTVLVDAWPSSIALGRAAATVAEMAFTVQCALFVGYVGGLAGLWWAAPLGWSLVPLIAAAQACCWTAVVTLDHRWHAAEELLWGVAMALLAAVFLAAWPGVTGPLRVALTLGVLGTAAGAYVMLVLDVPMYLRRAREPGRRLSLAEGWWDAVLRRAPTGAWEVWRREVSWMTPYFTFAVWLSISLVWW